MVVPFKGVSAASLIFIRRSFTDKDLPNNC